MTERQPTEADRRALARFLECADDGQDVDIGRPALDRLTALGWLERINRRRWQIGSDGYAVLSEMEAANG